MSDQTNTFLRLFKEKKYSTIISIIENNNANNSNKYNNDTYFHIHGAVQVKLEVPDSSSFGEIEKDKVFYLQSRGLSKDQAIKLLVIAFINELNLNDKTLEKNMFLEIESILLIK